MSEDPYDKLATKLARQLHQQTGKYLAEVGEETDLWTLARRVVWEWNDEASNRWKLDEALEALERYVGRPTSEEDI